jgi:hypothetical protein
MSSIGEKHRDSCRLSRSNDLFIAHTSTWLNNGGNACMDKNLKTISKREEGITCCNRSLCSTACARDC